MAIKLAVGKLLPKHDSYDSDAMARKFWNLSFVGGRNYIHGVDAFGNKILIPHEREKEGYERRKNMTKPRNHAGPIIRRYNNHVFRTEANRPEDGGDTYQMLLVDVDGQGTDIDAFMAHALEMAQIERECYLMLDSTKEAEGETSVAQAEAEGVRPIIKIIGADAVLDWSEFNDVLTEVLVVMVREDGSHFARRYNKQTYLQAELVRNREGQLKVVSISGEFDHGYAGLPVVRLRPFCGESQISPLSESQRLLTNLQSLLLEEICNVTFSQMVMTGVSATEVSGTFVGNNRAICIPNPAGSITQIGADPAQAATITVAIKDEERELYRVAGISSDDPTKSGSPESGIAKAFKHNDLSANLAALACAVEDAENRCMYLLFDAIGQEYPGDAKYPDEFDLPNISDDLASVISVVTITALPNTIKKKLTERFAQRHLSLDDKEQKTLQTELESISADPITKQPTGLLGT